MMNRKSMVVILLSLAASPCLAQMYKWTDDAGQVHYGQEPPAEVSATPIKAPPPPSSSAPTEKAALEQFEKAEQEAKQQAELAKELEEKKAGQQRIWRANCNSAKAQLTALNIKPRIRKRSGLGELSVMPEEELKKKIAQTEQDIELYCNPPTQATNQ